MNIYRASGGSRRGDYSTIVCNNGSELPQQSRRCVMSSKECTNASKTPAHRFEISSGEQKERCDGQTFSGYRIISTDDVSNVMTKACRPRARSELSVVLLGASRRRQSRRDSQASVS